MKLQTFLFIIIVSSVLSCAVWFITQSCKDIEKFEVDADTADAAETAYTTSYESQVIDVYEQIYNRQPNASEFKSDTRLLESGHITIEGMKQRMIHSTEYGNQIKLQSNELTPELPKMLSERDMLDRISQIYKEEIGKDQPATMVLPLRDVYILLDYNEYALRAMFRDGSYVDFENNLMTTPDLNRPQVLDEFNKKFNKNNLITVGQGIAKAEREKHSSPVGACPSSKYDRTIDDKDSDSCLSLSEIIAKSQAQFDKNAAALALSNDNTIPDFNTEAARTDIRIPTHRGDMVLIPELAWSVPQYRAPVCTTLGKPQLLQSITEENKILKGTPLKVAKNDTQIGSIMPKFKYQEYIDIKQ